MNDKAYYITEVKQLYSGELDFTGTVTTKMTYGPLQGRMAVFSFISLIGPIREMMSGGSQGFSHPAQLKEIIQSFSGWFQGNIAETLFSWKITAK